MDAPHAPAGWYPDSDGVERYWDGATWTDQTKAPKRATVAEQRAVEPLAGPALSKRAIIGIVAIGTAFFVLIGIAAALSGNSRQAVAADGASEPTVVETPDPVYVPSGFTDLGNGLAFDWDNEDVASKGCLTSIGTCGVVNVYATEACSFVYASANLLSDDGTIIGSGNDTATGMAEGDTARLTIQFTQHGPRMRLTDLHCS